jgi:predicted DNA-binding transcriptional regulator AlpA
MNNITKTAEDLGMSRPTLYDLMEKLKISKPGDIESGSS